MKCIILIRENGIRNPAWANFINHIKIEKYGANIFDLNEWFSYREEMLKDFNAVYTGKEVIFDSEHDKMFFLLRWS